MSDPRMREDLPEDDRPRRRRRDDDEEEERPRRRRRDEDYDDDYDDDYPRRSKDLGDDPAMRLLLPVGLSGWAIAAGYLGLVSVLCIPAPFALLTGILAIREMNRNPKKHGMGRAIFGIVMGGLGMLCLVAILVALLLGK
jgi:hypothetical protein